MESDKKSIEKVVVSELQYEKMERAENRLSRNLSNSFWSFANYTSLHFLFIYVVVKEMVPFGMPSWLIAVAAASGGTVIHVASMMSNNTYRTKLRVNEDVIKDLEHEMNDPQQEREMKAPRPFLFGAGDARMIIFYALWFSEIGIAYMFAFVK
jgi:hypothetical protein